ncbi:MAG: hypothetical protein VYE73_07710 [Acidobacteriota bacterium]|nr:hypothetical protein [Acidobacteriota bacterium]
MLAVCSHEKRRFVERSSVVSLYWKSDVVVAPAEVAGEALAAPKVDRRGKRQNVATEQAAGGHAERETERPALVGVEDDLSFLVFVGACGYDDVRTDFEGLLKGLVREIDARVDLVAAAPLPVAVDVPAPTFLKAVEVPEAPVADVGADLVQAG